MLFPPFPLKIKIATQEKVGKLSRISVNYMRRKVSVSLDGCHGHLHTSSSALAPVALPFAYTLNTAVEGLLVWENRPTAPLICDEEKNSQGQLGDAFCGASRAVCFPKFLVREEPLWTRRAENRGPFAEVFHPSPSGGQHLPNDVLVQLQEHQPGPASSLKRKTSVRKKF